MAAPMSGSGEQHDQRRDRSGEHRNARTGKRGDPDLAYPAAWRRRAGIGSDPSGPAFVMLEAANATR